MHLKKAKFQLHYSLKHLSTTVKSFINKTLEYIDIELKILIYVHCHAFLSAESLFI